jgi:nicotinamidase-related amidase
LTRGVSFVAYAAVLQRPVDIGTTEVVRASLSNLLERIDVHQIRSAAIPLMGSKIGRIAPQLVAESIVSAVLGGGNPGTRRLKQVVLVGYDLREAAHYLRAIETVLGLPPLNSAALLVVDLIEDFVGERHLITDQTARRIAAGVNSLGEHIRRASRPVVFIRDRHAPNDPELRYTIPHCLQDNLPRFVDSLQVTRADWKISKSSYSAFNGTSLTNRLRRSGVTSLLICGIQTHVCVKYSALDAMYAGFRPVVVSDHCASSTVARHEAGVAEIGSYFAETVDSAVLAELLTGVGSRSVDEVL